MLNSFNRSPFLVQVNVAGSISLGSTVTLKGNLDAYGTMTVGGDMTLNGALTVATDATKDSSSLTIKSPLSVTGAGSASILPNYVDLPTHFNSSHVISV